MSLDIHKKCAVCAWRATCSKKHTIRESALHCPDYTRDLELGPADDGAAPSERHKQVEDVFGSPRKG